MNNNKTKQFFSIKKTDFINCIEKEDVLLVFCKSADNNTTKHKCWVCDKSTCLKSDDEFYHLVLATKGKCDNNE